MASTWPGSSDFPEDRGASKEVGLETGVVRGGAPTPGEVGTIAGLIEVLRTRWEVRKTTCTSTPVSGGGERSPMVKKHMITTQTSVPFKHSGAKFYI